jgi:hypothetical protein
VALNSNDAIRVVLVDLGTQKGGRWKLRSRFYFYKCVDCGGEISYQKYDLKKVSGRCRKCADKLSGLRSSVKNRILPFEALYNKFRYDRQRSQVFCDISYEDFLKFTKIRKCHYCGCSVNWSMFCLGKNGAKYNLDRKDNSRGYLKNNVVVCCWGCNETKSDRFTYKQFLEIGNLIRKWEGWGNAIRYQTR